jgi:hypothetical protein
MHCIVICVHAAKLWQWLLSLLRSPLPWTATGTDHDMLFGLPLNMHANILDSYLQIWKSFHAETLRVIWFSRCQKKSIVKIFISKPLKEPSCIEYNLAFLFTKLLRMLTRSICKRGE